MTNLEKIRLMSAEELAKLIDLKCTCDMCVFHGMNCAIGVTTCLEGIIEWLNKEADNG